MFLVCKNKIQICYNYAITNALMQLVGWQPLGFYKTFLLYKINPSVSYGEKYHQCKEFFRDERLGSTEIFHISNDSCHGSKYTTNSRTTFICASDVFIYESPYNSSPCWLTSSPVISSSTDTRSGLIRSVIFSKIKDPKKANADTATSAITCTVNKWVSP